ncbi:MAG: hypothetical protein E6K86_02655 [Thaumarchaeota archaeon]|nr:MAG: hypothetical protein E6K86_02655 [Nitrososphaerota archaeon]
MQKDSDPMRMLALTVASSPYNKGPTKLIEERMALAEKAVEAIIDQSRRKKGTVRRTRRD